MIDASNGAKLRSDLLILWRDEKYLRFRYWRQRRCCYSWNCYFPYVMPIKLQKGDVVAFVGGMCGGKTREQQYAALRAYSEGAVLQGGVRPLWARVVDGIALGSKAFAQRLRRGARPSTSVIFALR